MFVHLLTQGDRIFVFSNEVAAIRFALSENHYYDGEPGILERTEDGIIIHSDSARDPYVIQPAPLNPVPIDR